jgi:predicted RNA-binding Zn ribbon-like protein
VTTEEAAEPIVALLNSRAHTIHSDALLSPATAADVLRLLGLPGFDVSERQLADLRDIRAELMGVLSAAHTGDDTGPYWSGFTARTSTVTFQQDFHAPAAAELRQTTGDPIIGRVVRLTADLIGAGRWNRLRVCANDECRGVFYDRSRSRTQRWHSYEICGNKHNVASYRSRAAT